MQHNNAWKYHLYIVMVIVIMTMTTRTAHAATSPDRELLPPGCVSETFANTVINISGWDPRTFGQIKLDELPPHVDLCDVQLRARWGLDEVEQMQSALGSLLDAGDRVVLVGYSMSGPFLAQMLDTWDRLSADPELLDRIDLVLVAPAAGVAEGVRGFVPRMARRWDDAWQKHWEGILARNHRYEWNSLIDRTMLILAGKERVVDNARIAKSTVERLGNNVLLIEDATHLDLRFEPQVDEVVARLLLRPTM